MKLELAVVEPVFEIKLPGIPLTQFLEKIDDVLLDYYGYLRTIYLK